MPKKAFPRSATESMKTQIVKTALTKNQADVWILFAHEKTLRYPKAADPVSKRLHRMIEAWIKATGFSGNAGEITLFPTWESLPARFVLIAGLGKKNTFNPAILHRTVAASARAAKKIKARTLAFSLGNLPKFSGGIPACAQTIVSSVMFGWYDFQSFQTGKGSKNLPAPILKLTDATANTDAVKKACRDAVLTGEITMTVRDIANLPGNEAPPRIIAAKARTLAKKYGLTCSVMGPRQLRQRGFNALLSVAQGSRQDAQIIVLKYKGRKPGKKPVALVGKTITFDTGGISLKPPKSMEWMKYDKCGGMTVLAATVAAARLRLETPVIGILAAAENMPGGNASRPGDIIHSYSGKTIEILNTDAEGRLALADALAYAAEQKPCAIVDLATLTGACITALGHVLSAVMGNNDKIVKDLQTAGERSGDRLWPFPLLPDYQADIKGQFADIKNIGGAGAGTIIGGIFLRHFVPENIPWAHIDIAGTAWAEKTLSYTAPGATLFGTNLLLDWMQTLQSKTK